MPPLPGPVSASASSSQVYVRHPTHLVPEHGCTFHAILHSCNSCTPDILSKMTGQAIENSILLKCSPGSHYLLVGCSLLCFCSQSASRLHVRCLNSSGSRTHNCARLFVVATPVLKASIKVKSHGNSICEVIISHMISAEAQTNKHMWKHKAILGPAGHVPGW